MSLLKKLHSLFSMPPMGDDRSLWLYAQCDKCGEILRGRVDLHNDLSIQYDDNKTSYFCRKVFIGSQRCYRPIEIELNFDRNRKVIDRKIKGGKFVEAQAYLAENLEDGD